MKFTFSNKFAKDSLLIYPLFEGGISTDKGLNIILAALKKSKEFEGKEGQTFFLYKPSKKLPPQVLLLGFGKGKFTINGLMSAIGAGIKAAGAHHAASVSIIFLKMWESFAQEIGEACALANYNPARSYKTKKALERLKSNEVHEVTFFGVEGADTRTALEKGLTVSETVNAVRDWVNAPPNIAHAPFFDQKANEIAKVSGAKLTILRKKELEKLNMGLLLGVNRGSPDEARLVILDYHPKGSPDEAPIVLVGKGILFDSGGYNLKPSGHIEDMQLDKAGAAAVIAVIRLLHTLGVKRHVIAVAPFTENLIGGKALKPSEILTSYSGKTVEITNTDAEGRLVLGDAVAYAVDKFKPRYLVDAATLTGACMVALGEHYAGLFGNDKELIEKLRVAGDGVNEILWPLPLDKDHTDKMRGQYADLRNTEPDRLAGASKGAAFIQEFVGKTKWAHLDIAGPAFTKEPKKYQSKGATGFGVRVLLRFIENLD